MAIITIPASELQKGQPVPDGWYFAKLVSFVQQENSKKDGWNFVPIFSFKDPKTGEERSQKDNFSNKALGIKFPDFYVAITGTKIDPSKDLKINTEDIKIGTELWIKMSLNAYGGRLNNKVDDYMHKSEKPSETPF